jgi:hypothetical protein
MIKIILLILGFAVGFGGGVYWAHKNPERAAEISAEEERRFLEAQLAVTEKIQAKLDQLAGNTSKAPGGVSGFVSGEQAESASASDVKELKADAQQQEYELRRRLNEMR